MFDFSKFKISDENRDVIVIESLKDDYIFLRKQIASFHSKEHITDMDEDNHMTDCNNVVYIYGTLKYYMNFEDFLKFLESAKLEVDSN